jgi:molybdopterin-containing oxidoreductase family iron-sulfur binding subunit
MKLTRREWLELAGACLVVLTGGEGLAVLDSAGRSRAGSESTSQRRKQWAMLVDTRRCAEEHGCSRCMEACASAHNVPSIQEPKHVVQWIWDEPLENVFSSDETQYMEASRREQPTPVLCNHCDDPPCVRVCPTGATWKREEDGIVMMDWHRCIGCRYCMAACPYGSRSFNWVDPRPFLKDLNPDFPTRTKGVVEKCNFCAERLVKGQPPACVEACPEKALLFGDVKDPESEIRKVLSSGYTLRRKPELGTGPNIYYVV